MGYISDITDRIDKIPRPRDEIGRGKPAAVRREDLDRQILEETWDRGDGAQRFRLRVYPTVDIPIDEIYAGSVPLSVGLDGLEQKLYDIGFRNNPTAYVEITEEFGPDDGSYSKQVIEADTEFPHLGVERPFGLVTWWNRTKDQYHATIFVDEERQMFHIGCHREASAWSQPVRHVTISEGDGMVGARDFRDFWYDEFSEELPRPLGLNDLKPKR